MPTPVVTLPKVASYLKNVGKSVKLASIDYLKDIAPNTSEFLETNEELFKEIYSATRNYKDTIKAANTSIKNSKVYEAATTLKTSLLEDLKTGKFYNKEREDALGAKALDMDFDFEDDFDMSSFTFDDDDDSDAAKTSRAFDMAMEASTKAQAKISVRSADMISETVKASTSALFAQQERMIAQMTSGLGSVYNAIENVRNFMDQSLMTSLQNTKVFQEKSMEHYNKMESMMDELLQMQRNLYNAEREERKESDYSKVVGFEGFPDLREYAKAIFKNTKSALGPEFDMLFGNSFGENANPLLMFVASPLKMLPELIVKTVVPLTVKKAAETLDESISGVFTTVLARLNKWATGEDGELKKYIGRIFGLNLGEKEGVNTGNFKKGPIPFDGITKQAIVEVIPGHLRRIEAALTGQSERLYDMGSGKWTNIKKVEKEYRDRQQSAVQMSFYDIRKEFDEAIAKMNKRDKEEYTQALETIMKKVYEDFGYFNPYRPVKDPILGEKNTAADYYDVDDKIFQNDVDDKIFQNIVKLLTRNKKGMMGLARRTMSERQSFSDFLASIEEDPSSVYRNLFNGQYNIDTKSKQKFDANKVVSPFTNFLTAARDEKGKNIFFYLRGIYGELLARRRNGGTGGYGSGRRPAISSRNGYISPEAALNEVLNEKTIEVSNEIDQNANAISDDIDENTYLKSRLEEEKKKEEGRAKGNLTKGEGTFVEQMLKAGNIGEKWKVVQNNISALLAKPSLALTSLLEKADARVYTLLFGKEEMAKLEDTFDKSPKGIVDYITLKIQESFTNLNDWLDDNVFGPLKQKLGVESVGDFFKLIGQKLGIYEPIKKAADWVKDKIRWDDLKGALKSKVKFGASEVKGSLSRTWGKAGSAFMNAVNDALYSGAITQEEANQMIATYADNPNETVSDQYLDANGQSILKARGSRFITKRGLAVVSPGEMIIPATFNRSGQSRQLAKERSYANRFGLGGIPKFAGGTDSPNGAAQSVSPRDTKAVKETIKKVVGEIEPGTGIVDIVADGLLGGGVSLITGMIGGPLLGVAAGAAVSISKQSKSAQEFLFGTEMADGTRADNGKIPKKVQDAFKKYFPDMKDFGIAGAVAGLFTPLGLVGGLMAGGAVGYLKNNDKFQEYLFGKMTIAGDQSSRDGGLISKEFRDKVKKAAPRMLAGAAGAALFGPFGLLGNAALGSALGYVTTTDKFHEFIFGKEDGNGNRKGGIVQALKLGLVNPLLHFGKFVYDDMTKWFSEKILQPLKDFANPFIQMIKNAIINVTDAIKDHFKETIGRPIADFVQHNVLEPLGRTLKAVLKGPATLAKFIVQTPFQALGFIGNNMRMSQIRKGTATDMTAAERVQWRKEHPYRSVSPDRLLRVDKFGQLDKMLATQFEGDEGLERMRQMSSDIKLYLNVKKEMGVRIAKMVRDAGDKISELLNSRTMQDPNAGMEVSVYTYVRHRAVDRIFKAMSKGDLNGAIAETKIGRFKDVPGDIINELVQLLNTVIPPIQEAIYKQQHSDETQKELQKRLSKATGGRLNNRKTIRAFMRNIDKEIGSRESIMGDKDAELRATIADQSTQTLTKAMSDESDRIVKALDELADIMAAVGGIKRRKYDSKKARATIEHEQTQGYGMYDPMTDYYGAPSEEDLKSDYYNTVASDMTPEEIMANAGIDPDGRATKLGLFGRAKNAVSRTRRRFTGAIGKFKRNVIGSPTKGFRGTQDLIQQYGIKEVGGALLGRKSDLLKMVNDGYSIVHDGNRIALAKDGKLEGDNAKTITRDQEEALKREMEINERLEKTAKGITGLAGGLLGAGWETIKWGTSGALGLVNNLLDSTPLGMLASAAKKVVGFLTITALLGYGSEMVKQVVWPFMRDKIGPWLIGTRNEDGIIIGGVRGLLFGNKTGENGEYEDGLLSSVANRFTNWWDNSSIGKFFKDLYAGWEQDGPVSLIKPILDWYGEGNSLFMKNLIRPLASAFVENIPTMVTQIILGVVDGIHNLIFGDKSSDTGESYTDSNGNVVVSSTVSQNKDNYTGSQSKNGNITFFQNNQTGQNLYTTDDGGAYYRQSNGDGTYTYYNEDGTVADNQNANAYHLAKSNEYTKYESNSNWIADGAASGVVNNILANATGFRTANIKLPTFSSESLLKSGRKTLSLNPFKAIYNGAKTVAKAGWNGIVGLGNIGSEIGTNIRNAVQGTADDAFAAGTKLTQNASNLFNSAKNAVTSKVGGFFNSIKEGIGKVTGGGAAKTAGEAVESAAKNADDVVKAATTADSKGLEKMTKALTNWFKNLGENSVVKNLIKGAAKILGTSIDDVLISQGFETLGNKFAVTLADKGASKIAKTAVTALAQIPIVNIAIAAGYFLSGWNDAPTILGVAETLDLPIQYNLLAALVNAIKNVIPYAGLVLSFVPTETIMNLILDNVFPIFGWDDESLVKLREESQKILDEANADLDPEDRYESIEEYNDANSTGILDSILTTVDKLGKGAVDVVTNAGGAIVSGVKGLASSIFGGNKSGSGRARRGRGRGYSGFAHIYQNDPRIANQKFGNSTIGEAGCGPVAITNLINKMGGNMDLGTAAKYAEKGGFIDSTGGTTTDYLSSMLNSTGIGATDSTDPLSVYDSLRQGNPAILLGNSGNKSGLTPFGSGDHYITAMGTDKQGNIIAEDPDLPQSMVKYKANEVLNDMDSAIIAGRRRGRGRLISGRRRKLFGRSRSGKAYTTQGTVEFPAWVVRAYSVIYSSEGGYNSVNANDNGAMSVGRLQWNAGNAKTILQLIFTAMIQSGEYSQDDITSAIGTKLYNDVMGSTSFANRIASSSEKSGLQKILDNDISKAVQDTQAMERIYNNYYMTYIKKRGYDPASQENVVIYCCDMMNQRPASATSVMDAAKKQAGSAAAVTLDLIYQLSLQDSVFGKSQYKDRRTKAYQLITGSTPAGTSMQSYTSYDIHDAVSESDATISDIASAVSSVVSEVFRTIYGDELASLFGITSSSSGTISLDSSSSSSNLAGDGYNAQVINYAAGTLQGQKDVVDKMNSIYGKIKYSRGSIQDPDQGVASCASTVGWAYNKALGVSGMSANCDVQSKDSRFTTIYTKNSGSQMLDTSILKPGDILYFNWDRQNSANNGDMDHAEMYASNNQDLSHGGNPEYGPVYKELGDYRRSTAMMVRRYNGFINNSGSGRGRSGRAQIMANANRYLNTTVPSTDYSNTANYDSYLNRARAIPASGSVSYEEFLNVIIELLVILAKNSDKQIAIIQALKKNNINVDTADISAAGKSRSGKDRLKQKLRAGLGREQGNGKVNVNDTGDNNSDISYIVKMMEALARD